MEGSNQPDISSQRKRTSGERFIFHFSPSEGMNYGLQMCNQAPSIFLRSHTRRPSTLACTRQDSDTYPKLDRQQLTTQN